MGVCVSGEAGDGRFVLKLCFCIKHRFFSQFVGFHVVMRRKSSETFGSREWNGGNKALSYT